MGSVSPLKLKFARWEIPRKRIQKSGRFQERRRVSYNFWQVPISVQIAVFCVLHEVQRMRFVEKFMYVPVLGFAVEYCRAWNLFAALAGHGGTWSGARGPGLR